MEEQVMAPDQLQGREIAILQRLAAGLSDQQIADDLVLSLHTVKWYNRRIYSKLHVKSRTQAIASAQELGWLHDGGQLPAPSTPLSVPGGQLPAPSTPFIGRNRELAEVQQLLGNSRLLTLTGTGGTGKTRLALRAAEASAATFADGVCFVDLAPLVDHTLVAQAIAGALGVVQNRTEALPETLQRVLAQRRLLLVIDNFEHVMAAAPLLAALLAAAPALHVLITSRESLRIAGEQAYPVPPLTLPSADGVTAQDLAESEAGALFVQRARLALPHFAASDANAPAIARICIRLDGLPLAIELAAARCTLLPPQALLLQLAGPADGSPFHALAGGARDAPPRHRSLRDTLAWSYNLLSGAEQTLFARLAVFRGGRSLEAIAAVCGVELALDVWDGLASLVDKSLVQQQEAASGEPRFTLLEMVQAYAGEQLAAGGEAAILRRRHADYFVALAEHAEPELRLAGYDHWCQVFELELDNIRAALAWSLSAGDVALGVRLAGAIGLFWYGKGHHVEGIRWTQQLLARLDEAPVLYHPKFLVSAAHLAWLQDLAGAQRLLRRALDIAHDEGDTLQTAWVLVHLSYTMMHEPDTAMALSDEALATFRTLENLPGIAQTLNSIAEIALVRGDDGHAGRAYEECLAVCRQTMETRRIGYMYFNLAYLALRRGDDERAMNLGRQGILLAQDRHDRRDIAEAVIVIAGSLGASAAPHAARLRRAAQLLGAAEAAFEYMGAFHHPTNTLQYNRIVGRVRDRLDDATFQAAWAEGRSLTLEQTIPYTLEVVGG